MYLVPLAKVSTECLPASHQPYEGEGALAVRGVLAACEVVMGHLGGEKWQSQSQSDLQLSVHNTAEFVII